MLGAQMVTGIVLAMHYTPHVDLAFNSVESIMRDVNYGWLLRYLHANGASFFFVAVYAHIVRGMYYGSYKEPREVLWILGVILFLLMVVTGFMGYVLPWGQMSFWAATVITNLFSAIPRVGDPIVTWLWGGYAVGNPTLNRFYSLHYLLPFVIAGVVVLHIWALHMVGQNNPTGVEPKTEKDTVAFTPYATVKDAFFIGVFCLFLAWFVFYIPNYLGHSDNYIPANPGQTPTHIVPEWYYLPFYAILRAIPSKLLGVIALLASIVLLAFLPWLDTSRVRSANYRPLYRQFLIVFFLAVIGLGYLGSQPPEGGYVIAARILTAYYFVFLLIILPLLGLFETTKPLPNSISEAVLPAGARRRRRRRFRRLSMNAHRSIVLAITLAASLSAAAVRTASAQEAEAPPRQHWSFHGPFGSYDPAQLQRGFKIYREVCSHCHSLKLLAFRNLADPGGPGFTEAQAAAIASGFQVTDGPNDQGEMFQRPGKLADHFPPPFPNDQAARAAMAAACLPTCPCWPRRAASKRGFPWFIFDAFTQYQEDGPDYIHAILDRLRRCAGRGRAAAGRAVQQVLSRPCHRDAEAAERRTGRIYRRRAGDCRSVRQGHLRLPDVGGGAQARRAQAARLPGVRVSHRADRPSLFHQEEGLARRSPSGSGRRARWLQVELSPRSRSLVELSLGRARGRAFRKTGLPIGS